MSSLDMYRQRTKLLVTTLGVITFMFMSIVFMIILDSVTLEPPYSEVTGQLHLERTNNSLILVVNRQFKKNNDNIATISGIFINKKTKATISLPSALLQKGEVFNYTYLLPKDLQGFWCIDEDIVYKYRFSLKSHHVELKDLCVEINEGQ
jgi:hypothetical protein